VHSLSSCPAPASSCPEAASEQRRGGIKEARGSKEAQTHTHTHTHILHAYDLFAGGVLRTELLATNIKTGKRKIWGWTSTSGRRGWKKTTPWFDLNEFSPALLLPLRVVRALLLLCSPPLSFFIPSPPPFSLWPCGVSTLLCRCGFILLFPGGLNFGCVHLSSCRARAAALSSHPYRYPTASSLVPASLVISSPGPGTCGLALELPVSMHPRSNSRPTPFIRRQNTSKFNGFR
jgi:hypothetical protein